METKKNILIAEPDNDRPVKEVIQALDPQLFQCEVFNNGKDVQLQVYKKNYHVLILDLDLRSNSGIEVLKYIKLNHTQIKVVLVLGHKNRLEELGLTPLDMKKFGVADVITKPCTASTLKKSIDGLYQYEQWKVITEKSEAQGPGGEVGLSDSKFTRIKTSEYLNGNISVFDLYIRLAPNKYIKILHAGERFDEERMRSFKNKDVEYLYFLTNDRGTYINYMNSVVHKLVNNHNYSINQKMTSVKSIADQLITEIHCKGLKEELVEEGKALCTNIYDLLSRDKTISQAFRELENLDPKSMSHSFLVCFFSTIICRNLDWSGRATAEKVGQGALLHDLGKIKLPPAIAVKAESAMTEKEKILYREHPLHGMKMLDSYSYIPEAVKQIVFQHHEYVNGTGFPNQLSGMKIYPLAKIVSFAGGFADFIQHQNMPPVQALRLFLSDRANVEKFDAGIIKAFVLSLAAKDAP